MSVMVIACYRPKPGKDDELRELMKTHLPTLRGEGLVEVGPSLCGKAKDGTIVEVFKWKSQAAIDAAHENKNVIAMWERFGAVCDYVTISDVEESKQMFSPFAPVDLKS
ncbi:antibiotic biosynthesis monooxygenase [Hyphococcus flavus]|uniref:Antibiotic biosynthesis monooxygenase n=1 Tax=Hyphococcus flavus TaxID=1866326 RepID=A0AAE9ZHJ2_9PROT|nr:antibiotic biosynthesis monooxygenase [Hyphococcus flavus]WDI30330.1 antibiotic biosynthesis monooxygenase [Hyphococcus flavus]